MVIEAFFRTATDARYAIRALNREGIEVAEPGPIPVQANNGRPWRVDVEAESGSLAERYSQPVLANLVHGIVTKHNGITEQVDRV